MTEHHYGRADISQFAVGRQMLIGYELEWQDTGPLGVEGARERYDQGLVELAQGRHTDVRGNPWMILYAFPRRQPVRREPPYFHRARCGR